MATTELKTTKISKLNDDSKFNLKDFTNEAFRIYNAMGGPNSIDEWKDENDELKYREDLKNEIVTIRGKKLINFNSCSYLGMHSHPKAIQGAEKALKNWGTGYAVSRPFSYTPFYTELERTLSSIYNRHALVGQSVSLLHLGYMISMIKTQDIIIIEASAHASLRYASDLCRNKKTRVITVSNWNNDENSMNDILRTVQHLLAETEINTNTKNDKPMIYFCADGVCSMRGICINPTLVYKLTQLNDRRVIAYIDDAHGMSLDGDMGQGIFHTLYTKKYGPMPDNLTLIVSLNKGWGSGGGALILPSERDYFQVIASPTSLMFSTQLQPSIMGANVEIAKMHQSGEIIKLQEKLQTNIKYFKLKLKPLLSSIHPLTILSDLDSDSDADSNSDCFTVNSNRNQANDNDKIPIFFLLVGDSEKLIEIVKLLPIVGILIGQVIYPVVPKKNCGFRISISANHSFGQIDQLINGLVYIADKVYKSKNNISENIIITKSKL